MDYIVCSREIQAESPSLEADEKKVSFPGLKRIDSGVSFFCRRGTVKILVLDFFLVQILTRQTQMVHKLA